MKKLLLILLPLLMIMSCDLMKEEEKEDVDTWVNTITETDDNITTTTKTVLEVTDTTFKATLTSTFEGDEDTIAFYMLLSGQPLGTTKLVYKSKGTLEYNGDKVTVTTTHVTDPNSNKYIDVTTEDDFEEGDNVDISTWVIVGDTLTVTSSDGEVEVFTKK